MQAGSDAMELMDLMAEPSFCVCSGRITKVNAAAAALLLEPGMDILPLLSTGTEEYASFSGGCLHLSLMIQEQPFSARVRRIREMDIFQLEPRGEDPRLQALALAARNLRAPLSGAMICADRLFAELDIADDPVKEELAARISQSLFQLMRAVGNMSDAGQSLQESRSAMEYREIGSVIDEIMDKAQALVQKTGITLRYTGLAAPVHTMVDAVRLERAIMNLISNSLKFTPRGGRIAASLSCRKNRLYFSISDNGEGIPRPLEGQVFSSYCREPQIEDGRLGIGLGMVLVCSTATQHGGTVLVDHPDSAGTRVTLSIAVRTPPGDRIQSPRLRVDYAGELDHALIELSNVLPAELYGPQKQKD